MKPYIHISASEGSGIQIEDFATEQEAIQSHRRLCDGLYENLKEDYKDISYASDFEAQIFDNGNDVYISLVTNIIPQNNEEIACLTQEYKKRENNHLQKIQKEQHFSLPDEVLQEIAEVFSNSGIECKKCTIKEFCDHDCLYNDESDPINECKSSWNHYIKQFMSDGKISEKSLKCIADKIGDSLHQCVDCGIDQFCQDNPSYILCSGTWYLWLTKKVGEKH